MDTEPQRLFLPYTSDMQVQAHPRVAELLKNGWTIRRQVILPKEKQLYVRLVRSPEANETRAVPPA